MSTHPYIPLYVDDFEGATAHLTLEEDGLYNRLLRLAWRTPGCSLPADHAWIARKVRMPLADFERVGAAVLAEFFKVARGRYVQKRLKDEYDDISRKKTARQKAGSKGGSAKAAKNNDNPSSNASDLPSDTHAFQTQNHTQNQKEESANALFVVAEAPTAAPKAKPKKRRDYPPEFEAVWRAYPHHEGRSSKPNAFAQWERLPGDEREALPGAIAAFKLKVGDVCGGKGAPDMALWLKDDKHLTWMAKGMAPALPLADHAPFPSAGVRQLVVAAKGETWAKTWLDQCRWDQPTKTIICPRQLTVDRLRAEVPDLELKGATITTIDPNTTKSRSAA